MGQLRIDTITKLLEASDNHAVLLEAYSTQKRAKLEKKYPGATQKDIFERSCQKNYRLTCQHDLARRFQTDDYLGELNDTSIQGISETSESVFRVRDQIFAAKTAKTSEDLVFIYLDLLHAIRDDRNPIVAKTAKEVLLTIHSQTHKKSRGERVTNPLAAACGLRFHANLESERFPNIVECFVDVWFGNDLEALKVAVKSQYKGMNLKHTRRNICEMHKVILEKHYAKALAGKYGPGLKI